jgi:hypothetical protein
MAPRPAVNDAFLDPDASGTIHGMNRFATMASARRRIALALQIAAVSLLLVLGQTIAVGHSDFDGHPGGEACALCVSIAHLGAADVAVATSLEIASSSPLAEAPTHVVGTARRVGVVRARGPPKSF